MAVLSAQLRLRVVVCRFRVEARPISKFSHHTGTSGKIVPEPHCLIGSLKKLANSEALHIFFLGWAKFSCSFCCHSCGEFRTCHWPFFGFSLPSPFFTLLQT